MKSARRSRRSLTSGFTVAALVGGLIAVGTAVGAQQAQAAVGPSWANACRTPLVFVAQGGGNNGTGFYQQQYTDTGGSFTPVGPDGSNSLGARYNSIGFNPNDNYVYGIEGQGSSPDGNSHLLKIDSTGTLTRVGIASYNGQYIGTNHGAFDPAGNFYVGGGSTIYKASAAAILAAGDPDATVPFSLLTTTGAVDGGSDFTYADGFLWSAGPDGTVWKTDLTTLVTTAYPNVVKPIDGGGSSAYGAAWTYGNGTLGFDANAGDNSTGLAVQTVDISSGTPTFVRQVSGPGSGNNDGASCSLPADLSLTKTINNQATSAGNRLVVQPGGAVTWRIGVRNSGPGGSSQQFVTDTVPAGVTGVSVTAADAQCSVNGGAVAPCSGVQPTAGQTLTVQYGFLASGGTRSIVLTATAPAGVGAVFDNTATVDGNEADPTPGDNSATAYATTPTPSFTLTKSGVDAQTGTASDARVGDEIQYSFTVQNTSSVVLSDLVINDPKVGGASCDTTAIAPAGQAGNTTVCNARYTVTQADFDAGTIHNVATATATAPGGTTVNAGPSAFDISMAAPASAVALVKTATPSAGAVVGTDVAYGFTVENTGTVSLSAVTVTDPMFPGGITCPVATPLAPGDTVTCSGADHTVTQADFDAGLLTNTATANATAVRGPAPAPSQSSANVTMAASTNRIAVTKTGVDDRTGSAAGALPGDRISYTFVITNQSNVTLTGASIADSLIGNAATCAVPAGGVAPGGTLTCTAPSSYAVTQNDVDAGSVVNTATATGTFARGGPASADGAAVVAAAAPSNSVTLAKTVVDDRTGTSSGARVGDTLSYTFVVTNTGNTSLTGASIADPRLPAGAITCAAVPAGGVQPNGTLTCTAPASYTVTQADVDSGTIPNTASVTATFRRGDPAGASASAVATAEPAAPAVTLTKTAADDRTGTADGARVGDTLSYGFTVRNSGNVSLTSAALSDPLLGTGAIVCPAIPGGSLPPGGTIQCSATSAYTVVQRDVDAGSIPNTATVNATFARGADQSDTDSAVVIAEPAVTAVTLTKTATDDRTGSTSGARVGDTVSYGFHVVNGANVSLASLSISDPLLAAGAISCPAIPAGGLAPGGALDCTATSAHTVTQLEFDAGLSTNTATVTAAFVRGANATDADTATVTAADPAPALGLVKSAAVTPASRQDAALTGDTIAYSFVVTNTGDVSVDTVSILDVDPDVGLITCPALPDGPGGDRLAPGSAITCTATTPHVITQREFDAQAPLVNTASALARPLRGPDPVTSNESSATVDLGAATPGLSLVKTGTVTPAEDQGGVKVGDLVGYTYAVTNTGNVTMYGVAVDDPHPGLGTLTCPDTSRRPAGADDGNGLAPGQTLTCSTAADGYTVTQADIDYGYVYDQATPSGYSLPGDPGTLFVGAPAEFTLDAEPAAPSIALVKSAAVTPEKDQQGAFAGDTIAYSFLVTNTGNITVRDVAIDDPDPSVGTITCPEVAAPGIAPGATTTCTADVARTVTQAEFDRQAPLVNTATASAQPLRGPATVLPPLREIRAAFPQAAPPVPDLPARVVSDPSTATVPLGAPVAGLAVVKTASIVPASHRTAFRVGDRANFTFAVTNTGNVTMTDIEVSDPKAGAVTCPASTGLAPGVTIVCRADEPHVFTQADVDRGSYTNSAIARGTPPPTTDLPRTPTVPSTVTVPAEKADPGITLVKTAHVSPRSHQAAAQVGDTITYTFLVTNTGNVTLTDVGVDDPTGGPVTCPRTTLAPGRSMTCRTDRVHTVTAAEAGGQVVNRATAFGTPPQGMRQVSSTTSRATVTVGEPVTPSSNAYTGVDSAGLLGSGLLFLLLGSLLLLLGLRRRTGRA